MKGLSAEHEIFLISLDEENVNLESLDHIKSFCNYVKIFKLNRWISILNVALGLFNRKPFQVSYFYRKDIKKQISDIVNEIKPDVIYCQLVRMAEYAKGLEYPKILDYMDAFSLSALRRSEHEKGIVKWFFQLEAKRLAKYELRANDFFDQMTIISSQDKSHMVNVVGLKSDDISIISNGLDTEYFSSNNTESKNTILFVGNMGYHPNILAAKYLIREIAPLLSKNCNFQIAGTRPIASIKSLSSEKVEVTGWLNDIRDAYNNSIIFVAPIFSGAGQQNKILEAMSMGLPCVTTSIVNEGIGAIDGEQIFIANSKEDFAEKINLLLKNKKLRDDVIIAGRSFIEEHYSWQNENKNLLKIIHSLKIENK